MRLAALSRQAGDPAQRQPGTHKILRAYGAELVFSSPLEGTDGAIRLAREIVAEDPARYFYADQYSNPANWQAHYRTTGVEVWEQTHARVTHFVAGLGTSGTFVGTGRRLRELNADIRLVAVQPDAPFHGLEGLKHYETAMIPRIYDASLADGQVSVTTEEAHAMVKRLAREEGLFVGVSSAAAAVAALQVAASLREGVVVTVFPDSIVPSIAGGAGSERKVDHSALRTNQAFIIALLLLAFITDIKWLVAFVSAVMLIGTAFPNAALFQAVYRYILRPLKIARPDVRVDNPESHLFAQGVGGTFLLAATVGFIARVSALGWVLSWIVVALAARRNVVAINQGVASERRLREQFEKMLGACGTPGSLGTRGETGWQPN